jgi:DNA-binding response OmpR family regulator
MSPRFLIADRDPTVREECRRYLAARGYEVDVAADGLQCIALLRATSPTVLVLDPEILGGGGDGVLDWLCDEAPLAPFTVLLINGQACGRIPERLHSMVAGRLERPRGLRELVQFVNRLEDEAWRIRDAGCHFAPVPAERSIR